MKEGDEQKAILDKIDYFFSEGIIVHLKLKKTFDDGRHYFLNGTFEEKLTDTLFTLKENKLGIIRVSLYEIDEISEFKEIRA